MGTLLAIQVSLRGHLVHTAALICMVSGHMTASAISAPLTLTVHRLAATRLGALLQFVCMRTGIPIVYSWLADTIDAAFLVFMVFIKIFTCIIASPSTNTVNWLCTVVRGALLVLIGIRTSMATVSTHNAHLVKPAADVAVVICVMTASVICIP